MVVAIVDVVVDDAVAVAVVHVVVAVVLLLLLFSLVLKPMRHITLSHQRGQCLTKKQQ